MQCGDKVSFPPIPQSWRSWEAGDVHQLRLLHERLEGNTLDWSKRDQSSPSISRRAAGKMVGLKSGPSFLSDADSPVCPLWARSP